VFLQFQGTVNIIRLYGQPQPGVSSQPIGSSHPVGYSQPQWSSTKLVTRGKNIVLKMEKANEVIETNKKKRKRLEWKKNTRAVILLFFACVIVVIAMLFDIKQSVGL
jgi:hypothetical protein